MPCRRGQLGGRARRAHIRVRRPRSLGVATAWVVVRPEGEILGDATLHRDCLTIAHRWCPGLNRSANEPVEVEVERHRILADGPSLNSSSAGNVGGVFGAYSDIVQWTLESPERNSAWSVIPRCSTDPFGHHSPVLHCVRAPVLYRRLAPSCTGAMSAIAPCLAPRDPGMWCICARAMKCRRRTRGCSAVDRRVDRQPLVGRATGIIPDSMTSSWPGLRRRSSLGVACGNGRKRPTETPHF